jgi:hypothetical protein
MHTPTSIVRNIVSGYGNVIARVTASRYLHAFTISFYIIPRYENTSCINNVYSDPTVIVCYVILEYCTIARGAAEDGDFADARDGIVGNGDVCGAVKSDA